MTEAVAQARPLPTSRVTPFDPPPELRERPAIGRLAFPDGHLGWLVTSHDLAKQVLSDPRFSSRGELRRFPVVRGDQPIRPQKSPPGMFIGMDPPDHTRLRKLLTGQFTVRRMKALEPRIEQIAAEHAALMREHGAPADLVEHFALPIPSLVICELLGVPYSDRAGFQRDSALMLSLDTPVDEVFAARDRITAFMADLAASKRSAPDDALMSGLAESGEVTDEEMGGIGMLLLIAGHETTANMLGLGTLALLQNPDQLALLRGDPARIPDAVEQLLRYLSIVHFGSVRAALEDVEVGGELVRAGEVVNISLAGANRDPARFAAPDELDVTESAQGHLAFGHGVHQCLGQQLARIEMRIGYATLLREFPGLRLAVPASEVQLRDRMAVYGVQSLPVAW